MREYVKQIFDEGLGITIFKPVKKQIDKYTSGNTNKILTMIIRIIYCIFALIIAAVLFYIAYPFN